MDEIYINRNNTWYLLDLVDSKTTINIQRNDFTELKDIQGDYSQNIKLPKTPKNREAFGMIDDPSVVSNIRHEMFPCLLISDGFEITQKGSMLKFVSIDSFFNVQIIGSLNSFFGMLKGLNGFQKQKTINDLSFSESIIRGLSGVQASQTITDKNIFFSICNFGIDPHTAVSLGQDTNTNFLFYKYGFQLPFVKYKHIIEKICFDNGGYSFASDILNDYEYTKACIPLTGIKKASEEPFSVNYESIEYQKNKTYTANDVYSGIPLGYATGSGTLDPNEEYLGFDIRVFEMENIGTGKEYFNYTVPTTGFYHIETSVNTEFQRAPVNLITSSLLYRNRQNIFYLALIRRSEFTLLGGKGVFFGDNSPIILDLELQAGDIIYTVYGNADTATYPSTYPQQFLFHHDKSYFNIDMIAEINVNTEIDQPIVINGNLPDITQYDFFKSFVSMYGLTITIDEKTKTIVGHTLRILKENKGIALDWSQKYINNSGVQKFTLPNYEKKNIFKFKESDAKTFDDNSDLDNSEYYLKITKGTAKRFFDNSIKVYEIIGTDFVSSEANSFDFDKNYFVQKQSYPDGIKINDSTNILCNDQTLKESKLQLEYLFATSEETPINETVSIGKSYPEIPVIDIDENIEEIDTPPIFLFDEFTTVLCGANLSIESVSEPVPVNLHPIGKDLRINNVLYSLSSKNMAQKYYSILENDILADVRFIENAEFLLTAKDIKEFNPIIPIYIKKYGCYFYRNKIKNFTSGTITKCDLIKI